MIFARKILIIWYLREVMKITSLFCFGRFYALSYILEKM